LGLKGTKGERSRVKGLALKTAQTGQTYQWSSKIKHNLCCPLCSSWPNLPTSFVLGGIRNSDVDMPPLIGGGSQGFLVGAALRDDGDAAAQMVATTPPPRPPSDRPFKNMAVSLVWGYDRTIVARQELESRWSLARGPELAN
jgi:hypothetical protein